MTFSLDSAEAKMVVSSNKYVSGVALDWVRGKIYWSSFNIFFRANKDGTEVATVLNTRQCKFELPAFSSWIS